MTQVGYLEVSFRIICSFFVLLVLTRIMGKTEIGKLNVFTFITAITIGNITASVTTENSLEIDKGIFGIFGWAVLTILMGYISIKSKTARRLITGEPTIVIRQGKIMEEALKKARLDFDTLQGMLRQQSVFSLKDVEYAIFEVNGSLSVMKNQDKKTSSGTVYKKTLIFPTSTGVISKGEINEDSLSKMNLDAKWLKEQLKKAGVNSVSDVFYAEVQTDGSLYIDYKADNMN
jgi:uncharacterized membrane protein YcaP (DUF421 family)